MKTTKRFFIALLAAFSVIAGSAQQTSFEVDGVKYAFNKSNGATYLRSFDDIFAEEFVVPERVIDGEGYEHVVTKIYNRAFQNAGFLIKVTLPSTIDEICSGAFQGLSDLKEVVVQGENVVIGNDAFNACTSLENIDLTKVVSIGASAFAGCKSLSSLSLPETLTFLGANAFENCTSLKSISLNAALTAVNVFKGCNLLEEVTFGEAVTSIPDGLLAGTAINSVIFPKGLLSIGGHAFEGTNLAKVDIPASVTTIGVQAFHGCADLTDVNFVSSPMIGTLAFPSTASLHLTIKDKETFYNENPNIFDKITYVREFSSESYASLILPFVPDQLDQMEVFQMVAKNDDCLVFKAVEDFVPGTPYMVKLNKEEGESSKLLTELTGTEVEVALSNQNYESKAGDWKMIGQYERIVLKADSCYDAGYRNYYYATAKNEFLYSEGKLAVSPFRAYIQAPKEETARVRMMIRGNDGVDTEIDMVELEDVFAPAVDAYYDLNGSRVVAPIEGQMYIVNGKKMIF